MKKNINDFTEQELLAELEKRKQVDLIQPVENPNFDKLVITCILIVAEMHSKRYADEVDDKHYIYEEAMKAVFGPDYFKWENKVLNS